MASPLQASRERREPLGRPGQREVQDPLDPQVLLAKLERQDQQVLRELEPPVRQVLQDRQAQRAQQPDSHSFSLPPLATRNSRPLEQLEQPFQFSSSALQALVAEVAEVEVVVVADLLAEQHLLVGMAAAAAVLEAALFRGRST